MNAQAARRQRSDKLTIRSSVWRDPCTENHHAGGVRHGEDKPDVIREAVDVPAACLRRRPLKMTALRQVRVGLLWSFVMSWMVALPHLPRFRGFPRLPRRGSRGCRLVLWRRR